MREEQGPTNAGPERLEATASAAEDSAAELDGEVEFYLILYPKDLESQIIETLEAVGVPGYTEFPKLIGRGRRIRHFDNPIWPGATGAVFTVIRPEQAESLVPPFRALNRQLDERSHGLYGLHLFSWPCRQLI